MRFFLVCHMLIWKDIEITKKGKIVFGTLGIFLIVVPIVVYGVSLNQKRERELSFLERVSSPQAEKKALNLVAEVGKLIDLPEGETPSLATVTGAQSLRSQEFYKNALDGDKVLIYQKAHMAYLYRPSTKKLINVMPAAFEAEEQEKKAGLAEVASASDAATLATPSGTTDTPGQTPPGR